MFSKSELLIKRISLFIVFVFFPYVSILCPNSYISTYFFRQTQKRHERHYKNWKR